MKKWVRLIVAMTFIIGGSLFLKLSRTNILTRLPHDLVELNARRNSEMALYFFFSKDTCVPCLDVIEVLNKLYPDTPVWGVLPRRELPEESEIRRRFDVVFPATALRGRSFVPFFSPTLVGAVGKNILFVLPISHGLKNILPDYLEAMKTKGLLLR